MRLKRLLEEQPRNLAVHQPVHRQIQSYQLTKISRLFRQQSGEWLILQQKSSWKFFCLLWHHNFFYTFLYFSAFFALCYSLFPDTELTVHLITNQTQRNCALVTRCLWLFIIFYFFRLVSLCIIFNFFPFLHPPNLFIKCNRFINWKNFF